MEKLSKSIILSVDIDECGDAVVVISTDRNEVCKIGIIPCDDQPRLLSSDTGLHYGYIEDMVPVYDSKESKYWNIQSIQAWLCDKNPYEFLVYHLSDLERIFGTHDAVAKAFGLRPNLLEYFRLKLEIKRAENAITRLRRSQRIRRRRRLYPDGRRIRRDAKM